MKHSFTCFSLVLACFVSLPAFALPIFSENRSIQTASGVVLFPDSEDPQLVHYFPGSSALVRDPNSGLPMLGMTYYGLRKNAAGEISFLPGDSGGFLSFTAHLAPTPEQSAEIAARLNVSGKVAVLPVRASTIELHTNADGAPPLSMFFTEFNLSRKGGQADANIGVNAVMNGLGARMMATQLKSAGGLKMDYCYQALGLSPLFKGTVQLNWSEIQSVLRTSFSHGGWFTRRDVSVTIQKLIREGALKIQIDAAPDSEATDSEFVMKVADMLMNRMFKTEIPVAAGSPASKWTFFRIGLDYGRTEVSENITLTLARRDQVTYEGCIPIGTGDLGQNVSRLIQSADGVSIF